MDEHIQNSKYERCSNDRTPYKWLAYSAHDWTVAFMWLFMDASNGSFGDVEFGATWVLELHST